MAWKVKHNTLSNFEMGTAVLQIKHKYNEAKNQNNQ